MSALLVRSRPAPVAGRFGVAVSTVVKWSQRKRATGSVAPGKVGGHRRPVLEPHRAYIVERVDREPHLTVGAPLGYEARHAAPFLLSRPTRRGQIDNGEPKCIALGGLRVDDAIEEALLQVVGPGAVEAAARAQAEVALRRDQVREASCRDLEAARYAADRAFRQHDAIDPVNRLVAGELEARWNAALSRQAEIEARMATRDADAVPNRNATPASFARLAGDLQAVWNAPTTDARLKKRIVRTLIQEVIADIDAEAAGGSGEIVLVIHWMGGVHTNLRLPRRRRGQRNSTPVETVEAIRQLTLMANDDLIAGILNRNGLRTGNGNRWTRERVCSLRSHRKIPPFRAAADGVKPWLDLTKAAAHLIMTPKTLRLAAIAGKIEALHLLPDGPWLFKRTDLDGTEGKNIAARARNRRRHPAGPPPEQQDLFTSTAWTDGRHETGL